MISAGQTSFGGPAGPTAPGGGQQEFSMPAPALGEFNGFTNTSPFALNVNTDMDPKAASELANGQLYLAAGSTAAGFLGQMANSIIGGVIAGKQVGVMEKYYETQGKIVGDQAAVAKKQLATQVHGMDVQQKMHTAQTLHEEKLARIQKEMQLQLAQIGEEGKTKRAEILATRDAFNVRGFDPRQGYFNGLASS